MKGKNKRKTSKFNIKQEVDRTIFLNDLLIFNVITVVRLLHNTLLEVQASYAIFNFILVMRSLIKSIR